MFSRRLVSTFLQPVRTYSSQPAAVSSGGGSGKFLIPGIIAAGAGIGYMYLGNNATVAIAASEPVFKGGEQGFFPLKLAESIELNHNTKRLIFDFEDANAESGMVYTSCLLTRFKPTPDSKPVIRPYTPTNDEHSKGKLELVVKKYEGGAMSTHLHDIVPGDKVDFKGPISKYPWNANKHESIAVIAGGTGITPMFQLIRAILDNPEDKTKITLVFGNISKDDILLHDELSHLETMHPRQFQAYYVLDKPPSDWKGGKGYITKDLLKTVLPEPKESNIKVFVCGPPGMYKAISGTKVSPVDQGDVSGVLKELGYTKEQVYKF